MNLAVAAVVGLWHAAILPTPESPVAFELRIAQKGAAYTGALVNGGVSTPIAGVAWDGRTLVMSFAGGGSIRATGDGGRLTGSYERAAGSVSVAFSAARTPPPPPKRAAGAASVSGVWTFSTSVSARDVETLSVALDEKGAAVTGVLRAADGAAGLQGSFDGERLVLSTFDGARCLRWDAEVLPDGSLAGELRSGTSPPAPFRAQRAPAKP